MNPDGQVILITGTRKGIGRFLAENYSRAGHAVHGCSRREPEWSAPGYVHHLVDVSEEAHVKRMMKSIRDVHGRLDVLINNAGVASLNHALLTPAATAASLMATNFLGTFLVCREASKLMQKAGYGRIVNFSTVAVPMNLEGEAIYAASKGAVETFSRVLARELAPFGITCNVVAPSPLDTDLIRSVPPDKIELILERLAIHRMGRFEDVLNVVDFYIRPQSDYITGQVIYLGGIG